MQDTRTAIARLESSEGDSSGVAAIAGWIAGSSNTNSTLRRNELLEPTAAVTRNVGPPAGSWTSTVAGAGAGAETLQIRSRLSSITCTFTPLFNQILRIILDQLASTMILMIYLKLIFRHVPDIVGARTVLVGIATLRYINRGRSLGLSQKAKIHFLILPSLLIT